MDERDKLSYLSRMHRFFVPPQQDNPDQIQLEGREAHHALHVLRVKRGEAVSVLDGIGHERICRIVDVSRQALSLDVEESRFTPASEIRVTLIQAIPKGKAWENILQKATELGAYRIVPVLTERVVVHVEADEVTKVDKWKWAAVDAMKQCGNPWLPQIDPARKFSDALHAELNCDLMLIASLGPKTQHPRAVLQDYARSRGNLPRAIAVWIGPEGDFTPEETQATIKQGAHPITLGPRVLRADTAAIYCLSVINYELGQ